MLLCPVFETDLLFCKSHKLGVTSVDFYYLNSLFSFILIYWFEFTNFFAGHFFLS